ANQISATSLVDNNVASLDAGTAVVLDRGESTTFNTYTGSSVIAVTGAISGNVTNASGGGSETIVPIGFASSSFVVPTNRQNEQYYIYAPYSNTSVQTYLGSSGVADQSNTVNQGTVWTSTTNAGGANGTIIEADDR